MDRSFARTLALQRAVDSASTAAEKSAAQRAQRAQGDKEDAATARLQAFAAALQGEGSGWLSHCAVWKAREGGCKEYVALFGADGGGGSGGSRALLRAVGGVALLDRRRAELQWLQSEASALAKLGGLGC